MFRLLSLLSLCLLVTTEQYNGNGGYPGGVPGHGLYPGDQGYGGRSSNSAGYHDAYQFCVPSVEDPDADCIPGEAGLNYPVFSQVPPTGFACQSHPLPGYYADQEAQCQVFHICQHDGRHDSFLCPNGSIFNQQYFVCDWWYNFDCATASSFYGINSELYQEHGFYGGAYRPADHAHGHDGLDHAGRPHQNAYGSHRGPLSHFEHGRHANGYSVGLSRAYGPNPLGPLNGYGPQGAPLSPLAPLAPLAPLSPLSPYENGKHVNGYSASLSSVYGPHPLQNEYGSPRAPLSPYENGKYANGHSASLSSAHGPKPIRKTALIPGSAATAKGY